MSSQFISFGFSDAIDILLVAIILYLAYNLVKGTSAINIFIGLALIYFVYIVVKAFDLKLLSSILGKFVNVGVIAVMILFQQEIRKFLLFIGSNEILKNRNWKNLLRFNLSEPEDEFRIDVNALAEACANLSASKTGALIVVARQSDLKFFIQTGEPLDASLNSKMLENIFFKNSPLHDGAVIVQDNRIRAARCILPVTEKENFPSQFGMRHRAAVGISEQTDAIAISVSEQTGNISLVAGGEIEPNLSKEKLIYILQKTVSGARKASL